MPPKTDVTLALSDLRQRRANLAVNLRKVVRRQMRQPYRAARAARPYVYASGPPIRLRKRPGPKERPVRKRTSADFTRQDLTRRDHSIVAARKSASVSVKSQRLDTLAP